MDDDEHVKPSFADAERLEWLAGLDEYVAWILEQRGAFDQAAEYWALAEQELDEAARLRSTGPGDDGRSGA